MLDALRKIRLYTESMSYSSFLQDEKTIDAVVRNLEVLGEAARQMPEEFAIGHSNVPWRKIAGLRNRIVKDYFTTDTLHMQIQYADYITQPRQASDAPTALMPSLGVPSDYIAPYPSPVGVGDLGQPPATSVNNGFNEDMIFFDGNGFCPGRILWSWKNTEPDDDSHQAAG